MGSQIISFITIIFTLLCIGFLAYITTKFVGKKSVSIVKSKYMKVVDTLSMGFDRTIYLVKVGEQYVLMYSSLKGFEFICNIDRDNINESAESNTANDKKVFSKYFDFFKTGENEKNNYSTDNKVIKNNIEKLRDTFNNKK